MSAIYLQHTYDPSFYYGRDRWVVGRQRARRFLHTHEAISFCLEQEIRFAQVHVCFGPGAADVLIAVSSDMAVAHGVPEEELGWV
jgi:hypothetical protein